MKVRADDTPRGNNFGGCEEISRRRWGLAVTKRRGRIRQTGTKKKKREIGRGKMEEDKRKECSMEKKEKRKIRDIETGRKKQPGNVNKEDDHE